MVTQKTQNESSRRLLARLAELYGVQTRYRDARGREREPSRREPSQDLARLGRGGGRPLGGSPPPSGRARPRSWGRMVEPVVVAWEGVLPALALRLPGAIAAVARRAVAELTLALDDGSRPAAELAWTG